MEIKLVASPNGITDSYDLIKAGQKYARNCYSKLPWEEILCEPVKPHLIEQLL